jgi:uncharacterized protein YegL
MNKRPRGELASRPLHFIWIIDCSSSMAANGKIQALNNSIREAIPHMQQVADDNPNANVLVRAIKFSSGAQWHITEPTPVAEFKWTDLVAEGVRGVRDVSDMGKALLMVAEQLKIPPMAERGLPPVLILVSNGPPTDDVARGIQAVMEQPWGKKAVRLAIAIGEDADLDVLQKFIGHSEIKPLQANNPEALIRYVKWQSTAVLKPVSTFKGEFKMSKRPGGELASRPLHFIWIADCSASMTGNGKIQALNNAIREAIPHMQEVANDNPNADVRVRAIKFSSGAQWHISQPTPVAEFKWIDLTADGVTDMGKAFSMVAEQLKIPPMTERGLPPVLILISDGQPTDDISKGLQAIMEQQWGKKAVRLAIAIGDDADLDVLQKFIGHSEIKPLQARNPEALTRYVKWASTAVLKSASSPAGQSNNSSSSPIPIPIPDDTGSPATQKDIW